MRPLPSCGRRRISVPPGDQPLIDRFRRARRDDTLAVLEGFHPLKHALRFGAYVVETVTSDAGRLAELTQSLAPDLAGTLGRDARVVADSVFRQLSPYPPSTGVISLARRRRTLPPAFAEGFPAPLVFLENPRSHANIGAAIRVAAAVGVAGVLTTGEHDPWHPAALVGSAGLHYALPVVGERDAIFREDAALPTYLAGRPLIAVDPAGEPLRAGMIPEGAILAFGSERSGLSRELLAAADALIAIPMQPGVSSLNLATAVAAVLYCWRLGGS